MVHGAMQIVVRNDHSDRGSEQLRPEQLLMVLDVAPGSTAASAGLLPGDILLAVDGEPLEEPGDIAWALAGASAGTMISLTLLRAGERVDVTLMLGA